MLPTARISRKLGLGWERTGSGNLLGVWKEKAEMRARRRCSLCICPGLSCAPLPRISTHPGSLPRLRQGLLAPPHRLSFISFPKTYKYKNKGEESKTPCWDDRSSRASLGRAGSGRINSEIIICWLKPAWGKISTRFYSLLL